MARDADPGGSPRPSTGAVKGRARSNHHGVRPRWEAWALLTLCLVVTLGAWYASNRAINDDLHAREASASRQLRDATRRSFAKIVDIQDGVGHAVAAGQDDAARIQLFKSAVGTLNLIDDTSGVVGLALVLPNENGDPEPVAIGPDYLSSSISTQTAIEVINAVSDPLARSTVAGAARASGPIKLPIRANASNADQPSTFVSVLPVFKAGVVPATAAERRENVVGWIAAAAVGNNFMRGVLSQETGFATVEMYDGARIDREQLLARQPVNAEVKQTRVGPEQVAHMGALGRPYTMRFRAFFTAADPSLEIARRALLLLGLGICALAFVLAWMQRRSEIRANTMVDEATARVAKSEERFRALVQDSNDMVVVTDAAGRLTYASPAGSRILGYEDDDLLGVEVFSLIHPDDQDVVAASFQSLLEADRIDEPVEYRTRRADHTWVTLEAKGTNQLDNPAIQGLVIHARDISERKKTEAELRAVEERFRAVVQNSSDVLIVLDTESHITYASDAAWPVLGYRPEDLTMGIFDLVHPDDHDAVARAQIDLLTDTAPEDPVFEIRVRHHDGHWVHLEIVANNLVENPAIRGILVSARDITERKLAEAELHAAQERFHSAFAHTPLGMMLANPDGSIFRVNGALCDLLGTPAEDLIGEPITAVFTPAEHPRLQTELRALLAEERTVQQLEVELATASNEREAWGAVSISLVRDDAGEPIHYIAQIEDISERKAIREHLWHQSHHDPLTGLPNRVLFMDRLARALDRSRQSGRPVAVIFLDLDRFKRVNDSAGHASGDALLSAIAERLQATLRPDDTVARFGGDEFAVLCTDLVSRDIAREIADRMGEAVARPIMLDEEVYVTASIGIAVSDADDTPEGLLHAADTAMYLAKENGRARTEVFEPAHEDPEVAESIYAGTALYRALSRHELRVHYQPFVNLITGRLIGFEALVRWEHPERGLLLPEEFIGLAEETGLIVPIGMWMFEHACRQAADWQARSPLHSKLMMSVNLSPRQLLEPGLADEVQQVLQATGVDPDTIWLEITESTLMRDAASTLGTLRRLRTLGPHLAVDDFGTGYSSLSYLQRYPVESLKVDRSFVEGLGREANSSAIVTAIVSLAHSLDLAPIAEGVERPDQIVELRALGCEYAQGYLFGQPRDAVETEAFLDQHPDLDYDLEEHSS